jgi:hypothetical protein
VKKILLQEVAALFEAVFISFPGACGDGGGNDS